MAYQDFSRSKALNNIPAKKLEYIVNQIKSSTDEDSVKALKVNVFNRYAEANIPVEHWTLKMEKDFTGDPRLLDKYNDIASDIPKHYTTGTSICFAGSHGRGKTMTASSILKKVVQKGYTALYTNLSDVVNVLTTASAEEKYAARRELCMVDFLVIDEFDNRFIANENAADLYARTLENIFRTRSQNKIPTFMCTNSPNVLESFSGPLKQSMESLFKGYMQIFVVLGSDFRKKEKAAT
jgi:DNA replication protein DnaC